jgi:hypothetical protein
MPEDITDIMAAVNEERSYADSQVNRSKRLKLDKGASALIRVLPTQMGARKTWFIRVGWHWVNGRPYICKRTTSPDLGGDPECVCELCELCDQHLQSHVKEVADRASRASSFPQWLFYAVIFEKQEPGDEPRAVPKSEQYVANEVWINKYGWQDLCAVFTRSTRKGLVRLGFVDPEKGNDLWMRKDGRGATHFEREEPAPLVDKGATEMAAKIITKIRFQDFSFLTAEKMDEALAKLEDYVLGGRRLARRSEESEVEPVTERRSARYETPAPAERRRSEEPVPETRQASPASSRRVTPAEVEPAAGPVDPLDDPDGELPPVEDEPPPPVRASPPPSVRRDPPPPPARRTGRVVDESEEAPPEARDPAPPISTAASGTTRTSGLSEVLRRGVRRLQEGSGEAPTEPARRRGDA